MKNQKRDNNISAAGAKQNKYTNMCLWQKQSFLCENHKRGNNISAAGALYTNENVQEIQSGA